MEWGQWTWELVDDGGDFEVCLFCLIAIPVAWRDQGYFPGPVWEGHPTQKNLYSLLHIKRVRPTALSGVTVPEWLQLEVMIVPVWNILKWYVLCSFQTQWKAFCPSENVTDCRPHNGFVVRRHLLQVGAVMGDTDSSSGSLTNHCSCPSSVQRGALGMLLNHLNNGKPAKLAEY